MCWPRPPGPRSAVEENLASACISRPAEEPAEDTPRSLLLPAAVDLEVLMWHRAWNWAGHVREATSTDSHRRGTWVTANRRAVPVHES